MWFAKWFGGRSQREEDYEEPTATAPVRAPAKSAATTAVKRPAATAVDPVQKKKGFDPYNSGSFERRNAWERVPRR